MTCKYECDNCTDPVKKVVKGSETSFHVNGTNCNLVQELAVAEDAGYRSFLYPDGTKMNVYEGGMAVRLLPASSEEASVRDGGVNVVGGFILQILSRLSG